MHISFNQVRSFIIFFVLGLITLAPGSIRAKAVLLNEESGLSNAAVLCIAKDGEGLMWIGTRSGLNTYDGYSVTQVAGFNGAKINALYYDASRDFLWVGSSLGLQYIDCKTGAVIKCTRPDAFNEVIKIFEIGHRLYIGFSKKYLLEIAEDERCRVIYHYPSGHLLTENKMTSDSKGNIYLMLNDLDKIIRVNVFNLQSEYVNREGQEKVYFLQCADSLLVVGMMNPALIKTDAGFILPVYLLQKKDTNEQRVSGIQQAVRIVELENNTTGYQQYMGNASMLRLVERNEPLFENKWVFCIYADEFNILWIGTNRGLIVYTQDKPKINFEKLLYDSATKISTREIVADSKNIYVASYNGLFRYNPDDKKHWNCYKKIKINNKPVMFIQRALLAVPPDYLYVGSEMITHSFTRFNLRTKVPETGFIRKYKSHTGDNVFAIERAADGTIWMGTFFGLAEFRPGADTIIYHKNDAFDVGGQSVRVIRMLNNGKQFWAGCSKGLYLVDTEKGIIAYFDKESKPALSDNTINVISEDQKGNTWIGTSDGGIDVLSANRTWIYSITHKNGLSNNEICGIQWQDSSNVWISTYKGLNHYSTVTHNCVSFFTEDGITDNEFNQNSSFRSEDGKLYFGGMNGITAFYPQILTQVKQSFHIYNSAIHKPDRLSGGYKEISGEIQNNKILLEPGENHLLTFSFAIDDYAHPEKVSYLYRIKENGDIWVDLEDQHTLRLASLQPGDYTLQVKAQKGNKGVVSENVLEYRLRIKQVFFKTVWFYLFVSSASIFLIVFYFSIRLRNLEKLNHLRVRIASNLHDEVGSLLTRITMSMDYLGTKAGAGDDTRDELEKVSGLSRAANVAMSDVLWSIDARNDFAVSLIDRMREHAEYMLLAKGIEVNMKVSDVDEDERLSPELRQQLFLIFKESINNISKHSDATFVEIVYGKYMLMIRNNGVRHRPAAYNMTGQGLKNIKMRAKLLNGYASFDRTDDEFCVTVYVS